MNEKVKAQYKALLKTMVEEEDWQGIATLVATIMGTAALETPTVITPPINTPPIEEQVPDPSLAPQPTAFDEERAKRMGIVE